MSDTKFTPGPWYVGFECSTVVAAEDSVYGVGVADCSLGSDDSECRTQEECEANARLIAAAPEMLEALRRVDENWTSKFSGPDNPVALNRFSDTTIAIWRSIRDAIAKAEGRQ